MDFDNITFDEQVPPTRWNWQAPDGTRFSSPITYNQLGVFLLSIDGGGPFPDGLRNALRGKLKEKGYE